MPATPRHPNVTPWGCMIDGRKFVRSDTDPAVSVHLDYAYADDRDPEYTGDRDDRDPLASAVTETDAGAVTVWTCRPTGDTKLDPDTGYPAPVYAWADDAGDPAPDPARLDAALDDVDTQWEEWQRADAAMGDACP